MIKEALSEDAWKSKLRIFLTLHCICFLFYCSRSSRLMTMCACGSLARTTWSASQCCVSTALPPSSPHPPSCSGPSTPSQDYAAAAQWDSRVITVRQRSTCATPTPVWTEGCVPAEREGTPVSAAKTTPVSSEGVCACAVWKCFVEKSVFVWRTMWYIHTDDKQFVSRNCRINQV